MAGLSIAAGLQGKPDGGTHVGGASDVDGLPVRLYNMLANSKPQSCTAFVPASGGIRTVKPLKYP